MREFRSAGAGYDLSIRPGLQFKEVRHARVITTTWFYDRRTARRPGHYRSLDRVIYARHVNGP